MRNQSIFKSAFRNLFRITLLFSTIVAVLISIVIFQSLKQTQLTNAKHKTQTLLSAEFTEVHEVNFPSLLKDIQRKVLLQELIFIDQDCNILASTTLESNPCEHKNKYEVWHFTINDRSVYLYARFNYSYRNFLQDNIIALLLILIIIWVALLFILMGFLQQKIIKPISLTIERMKSEDFSTSFPIEFKVLQEKLMELQSTISKIEANKNRYELARRVVHDIRNPVLYLRSVALKSTHPKEINKAIQAIEYQIENLLSCGKDTIHSFSTRDVLEEVSIEIKDMFRLNSSIHGSNETLHLPIHQLDLKNILSNLARNSAEARATNIEFQTSKNGSLLMITITDNGIGIPIENQDKIFTANFTSKENGNGIGLASIFTLLNSKGGGIVLDQSCDQGTRFIITLPLLENTLNNIVLIDDDKLIHYAWKNYASKKNNPLTCFFTVHEFIQQSHVFDKSTNILIDSFLENEGKGEILAKEIYDNGFHNIYLCSSDIEVDLKDYPWIKGRIPKRPSF